MRPLPTQRCLWCGVDPIYVAYHDKEWGVPELDDRALFEKLILDGFQAGLSWITILKSAKRFARRFTTSIHIVWPSLTREISNG